MYNDIRYTLYIDIVKQRISFFLLFLGLDGRDGTKNNKYGYLPNNTIPYNQYIFDIQNVYNINNTFN